MARPERPGGSGREQGFTLLEVLVAFALFSILFTVLLHLMAGALRNTGISAEHDRAVMLARSTLAGVGTRIPLEPGHHEGGMENGDYRWQLSISPAEHDADAPMRSGRRYRFYDLRLTIHWGEGDRQRHYRVDTKRLALEEEPRR